MRIISVWTHDGLELFGPIVNPVAGSLEEKHALTRVTEMLRAQNIHTQFDIQAHPLFTLEEVEDRTREAVFASHDPDDAP